MASFLLDVSMHLSVLPPISIKDDAIMIYFLCIL